MFKHGEQEIKELIGVTFEAFLRQMNLVASDIIDNQLPAAEKSLDYLNKSNYVLCVGEGKSGFVADRERRYLKYLGFDGSDGKYAVSNYSANITAINEESLVIGITASGSTKSVVEAARVAKEHKAKICLMTERRDSVLLRNLEGYENRCVMHIPVIKEKGVPKEEDFFVRQISGEKRTPSGLDELIPLGTLFEASAFFTCSALSRARYMQLQQENPLYHMQIFLKDYCEHLKNDFMKIDKKNMVELSKHISKSKKIAVTGPGDQGFAGKGFVMRLSQMGYDGKTVLDGHSKIAEFISSDEGKINFKNYDTLVACSGGGTNKFCVGNVTQAKKDNPDIKIFGLTSNPESPLAKSSDYAIIYPTKSYPLLNGAEIRYSDLNVNILLESLVAPIKMLNRISSEEMGKRHHQSI